MKKRPYTKADVGRQVEIHWQDIAGKGGWHSETSGAKLAECQTMGWIAAISPKAVVIASSYAATDEGPLFGDLTTIPHSVVKKVRYFPTCE